MYFQGCIKFPIPVLSWKGGEFIKFVGEEYQVVKRGREYHGCGEEYNSKKREKGSIFIFSLILRLLGRVSIGEEIKGMKIKILKIGVGKNI